MSHLDNLIQRWRTGDLRAAEEIYNLHRERVYRLSYGLLGDPEDAEEAAQDALTYALMKIENYDPRRSQFTTWLHMITVSRCRDLHRKRRQPTFSLSEWVQSRRKQPANQITAENQVIRREDQHSIWEVVQELTPPLREAIILRHWGGQTYQEIANIVGCPIRTAQSRVRLAHKAIKKTLFDSKVMTAVIEDYR